MKSLAELKRTIKPGVRLLCVENTRRPILNGRIRVVCRVQTNAFTWKHENETHELTDAASCTCGGWTYKARERNANRPMQERIQEDFLYHKTSAERESWTNYEAAGNYSFNGNRFTFFLGKPGPAEPSFVTLEVLPAHSSEVSA